MKKIILIALVLSYQMHAMQMETAKTPKNGCPSVVKACCYAWMACALITEPQMTAARPIQNGVQLSWYNAQRIMCDKLYENRAQDVMALEKLDDWEMYNKEGGDLPPRATVDRQDINAREQERKDCVRRMRELLREAQGDNW